MVQAFKKCCLECKRCPSCVEAHQMVPTKTRIPLNPTECVDQATAEGTGASKFVACEHNTERCDLGLTSYLFGIRTYLYSPTTHLVNSYDTTNLLVQWT